MLVLLMNYDVTTSSHMCVDTITVKILFVSSRKSSNKENTWLFIHLIITIEQAMAQVQRIFACMEQANAYLMHALVKDDPATAPYIVPYLAFQVCTI